MNGRRTTSADPRAILRRGALPLALLVGAALLLSDPAPTVAAPGQRIRHKRPRKSARSKPSQKLVKIAVGKGSQLRPAACRLANGTVLLAFERLRTVHRRRVYVNRRRPRRGWSWARAVPTVRGDFTQRSASLVARPGGRVLLYVQVGDIRRRKASVRLFQGKGDSLRWKSRGLLTLGGPTGAAWTRPFATPDGKGGVLLTATRRFAGSQNGCHLARSKDGRTFAPIRRIGPGDHCRVMAWGPSRLVLTYQTRKRRTLPWQGRYRLSTDGGKTWGAAQPVSKIWGTADIQAVALPDGALRFFYAVRKRRGSAIQSSTLRKGKLTEARLTHPKIRRDLFPFGLVTKKALWLFFAREKRPMDFDVLGKALKLPPKPRPRATPRPGPTPAKPRPRPLSRP